MPAPPRPPTRPRLCVYAGDRRRRPDCDGVAAVAYGAIALCAGCDRARSLVGDGIVGHQLPDAELCRLTPIAHQLVHTQQLLARAVHSAREAGASWNQIGETLGVTERAALKRWGDMQQQPTHFRPPTPDFLKTTR
jgi:hypothetical protein